MGEMRYTNIDFLKAILAFFIVCIHSPFPGVIGAYFTVFVRIAVPIFFMITGYFYVDTVKKKTEIRQIKKILKLCVFSNLIYLIWSFCLVIFEGESMYIYLTEVFNVKKMLYFLLLNESPFSSHLWYLGGALYVLVIVLIADRLDGRRVLYYATPILLLVDLLFGKYSLVLLQREFSYVLVRNFLFVGIPYFCIGCMVRDVLAERIVNKKIVAAVIVIGSVISVLERYILEVAHLNATREHYLSTTFVAVAVFVFVLSSNERDEVGIVSVLSAIGKKYSSWIYVLHPIFIKVIGTIVNNLGFYDVYKFVAPFVVYLITILFLVCVTIVNKFFRISDRFQGMRGI